MKLLTANGAAAAAAMVAEEEEEEPVTFEKFSELGPMNGELNGEDDIGGNDEASRADNDGFSKRMISNVPVWSGFHAHRQMKVLEILTQY